MRRKHVKRQSRLNIKLDADLKEWARDYAKRRGTDITKLLREYLILLRDKELTSDGVEQI